MPTLQDRFENHFKLPEGFNSIGDALIYGATFAILNDPTCNRALQVIQDAGIDPAETANILARAALRGLGIVKSDDQC